MISQTTIELPALGLCDRQHLRMFGDAIPNGFNQLDALIDAETEDFF